MVTTEIVFLTGAAFQIAVILPMLFDSNSLIPRETSIPTTLIWFVYAVTYFGMSFHLAALANVIGGSLWGLVAFYRARPSEQEIDYSPGDIIPETDSLLNSQIRP